MKTSQLIDVALDWAVAEAEGFFKDDMASVRNGVVDVYYFDEYSPSTNWALGGAIIEREKISLWSRGKEWAAESFTPNEQGHEETGKTPLVAAMRCYVASKMGDEVQLPEELQ